MIYEHLRETYEKPAFPLGLRVNWIDEATHLPVNGYINGYWGGVGSNPVALMYGAVPDASVEGEAPDAVWLHYHQLQPQS